MYRRIYCYFKLLAALWLLPCAGGAFAQKIGTGAQIRQLSKMPRDTNLVIALAEISYGFQFTNPEAGINYGEQARELAENLHWQKGVGAAYTCIGLNYLTRSLPAPSLEYFTLALKIANTRNDRQAMASAYAGMGEAYMLCDDYAKALENLVKARDIYQATNSKKELAYVLANTGLAYIRQNNAPYLGNVDKALACANEALNLFKAADHPPGIARVQWILGNIYSTTHQYHKAGGMLLTALRTNQELGNKKELVLILNSMGVLYQNQRNYAGALRYYQLARAINEELGNNRGIGRNTGNMGGMYLKMAFDTLPANYPADVRKGDKTYCLNKAIGYLREAIAIDERTDNYHNLYIEYGNLATAEEMAGNIANAYKHYQQHISYRDKVFNQLKTHDITQLELQYAFGKQRDSMRFLNNLTREKLMEQTLLAHEELQQLQIDSQRLALSEREKELQQVAWQKSQSDLHAERRNADIKDSEIKAQKQQRLLLIGGIFVLAIFSAVIIRSLATQRRLNNTINKLVNEQEKTIEQRTHALRESNEKLRALISFNSHQIREPLTRILGTLLIRKEITDEQFIEDFLPHLDRSANDLDQAIKDVLHKSQVTNEDQE
jgi:tetratricopeptide (TPR) repeat protein